MTTTREWTASDAELAEIVLRAMPIDRPMTDEDIYEAVTTLHPRLGKTPDRVRHARLYLLDRQLIWRSGQRGLTRRTGTGCQMWLRKA